MGSRVNRENEKKGLSIHVPVFLEEAVGILASGERGGIYVDLTVGGGGHSERILEVMKGEGYLYGFDVDPEMISKAQRRLSHYRGRFELIHEDFKKVESLLGKKNRGEGEGHVGRSRYLLRSC